MRTPFLGSSYTSRSSNLAAQRCVNLYPELVETRDGKAVGAFYGCPGETLLATLGAGPVRGALVGPSGLLYVVSGSGLYSVSATWSATQIGTLGTSTGPVSMVYNGVQLGIFDGSAGYAWNGSTFSTIALPFTGPVVARVQDGLVLVNELGTTRWWQSDYKDLTTFNGLNFGNADAKPSAIVGLGNLHREMWFMKADSTEIWVDAGVAGVAFQRLQGVFVEFGCAATWSVVRMGDSLIWLSTTGDYGQGVVVMSEGYRARPISTHAIEQAIQGYSTISDAIAFAYQDAGHFFYQLTFPTANATWCWDLKSGLWHERPAFVNGAFQRHDANAYAFYQGRHVVGDWQSGNLYGLDLEVYTDNGRPRKWLRSWRALPPNQATDEPMNFDALRIDMESGMTVPAGTNPQVALRWSDDGGHNWSNELLCPMGQTGQTAARVRWVGLGQTREESGLDRVFEISSSDPVRAALIGADLELS